MLRLRVHTKIRRRVTFFYVTRLRCSPIGDSILEVHAKASIQESGEYLVSPIDGNVGYEKKDYLWCLYFPFPFLLWSEKRRLLPLSFLLD